MKDVPEGSTKDEQKVKLLAQVQELQPKLVIAEKQQSLSLEAAMSAKRAAYQKASDASPLEVQSGSGPSMTSREKLKAAEQELVQKALVVRKLGEGALKTTASEAIMNGAKALEHADEAAKAVIALKNEEATLAKKGRALRERLDDPLKTHKTQELADMMKHLVEKQEVLNVMPGAVQLYHLCGQ